MRILFALHGYLPDGRGGTEVHAHALARALSRNHDVQIVARSGDTSRPDFSVVREVVDGIPVTRINNLYAQAPGFEWIYKNARVHELFEQELVRFKPDLVHIHHLTGLSTTIVETIKAGGLPLVMTLHDFWTVCPRGQRMTRELTLCETIDRNICFHCLGGIWPQIFANRNDHRTVLDSRGVLAPESLAEFDRHMAYILGLADVLVTPSEFHRERMLDFPLPADRMVALPHGLDHTPFRGVTRARRPVKRIGFIGSVVPVKGAHVLVDAFRLLARADLELHIHGEGMAFHDDKNYFDRLQSRAIGQRNIFFHGAYRPVDLPRILANLDVLVVPSLWWESFCLTIREGMMAGVPVIASDLGAMREALDGERDGLLFRAGDPRDLADRLEQLIEDESLRVRLSNRGEAVKTIEQYANEMVGLYERAMATSTARAGSIVVAPSSFPAAAPEPPAPPKLDVAFAPAASADVRMEAPEPAADGNGTVMRLVDRKTGAAIGTFRVGVESTPAAAAPAAPPAPKAPPAAPKLAPPKAAPPQFPPPPAPAPAAKPQPRPQPAPANAPAPRPTPPPPAREPRPRQPESQPAFREPPPAPRPVSPSVAPPARPAPAPSPRELPAPASPAVTAQLGAPARRARRQRRGRRARPGSG